MTQEHPITPPPELVQQWVDNLAPEGMLSFATQASRWGADQELEACVNYVDNTISGNKARALRAHRRPKPPSLKEQALGLLNEGPVSDLLDDEVAVIRRALESLPE